MARPVTGATAKTISVPIRLEPDEATAYSEVAASVGLSRSEWMRNVLNSEVVKSREQAKAVETTVSAKRPPGRGVSKATKRSRGPSE